MQTPSVSYRTKPIAYKGRIVPILLQAENGPCALLALANNLLLKGVMHLHPDVSMISTEDLVQTIGNIMLDRSNGHQSTALHHAVTLLPRLDEGLHVNVKFSSIDAFESSPELGLFSVLDIPLYHCWLPSEEDPAFPYVASSDFDKLQISLVQYDALKSQLESGSIAELTPAQEALAGEAQAVERWLELNSGQVTADGLFALSERVRDGELAVLFRNNHFATITKHKGGLFLLVTDEGYLGNTVVWESFNQLDGDAIFLSTLSQQSNNLLEPHLIQPTTAAPLPPTRVQRPKQEPRCCCIM